MTIHISMDNGNIDAAEKDNCWTIIPPTDGPINAPAEYRDVKSPEISAYVSMLSGNPPLEIAKIQIKYTGISN